MRNGGGFVVAAATFLSLATKATSANEFVVAAFRQLEQVGIGGQPEASDAIERRQLIAALSLILFVSVVLIASVALFRCFILYCQSYENTRRFHSPLYRRSSAATYAAAHQRVTLAASSDGVALPTANGGTAYSFQSVFYETPPASAPPHVA